LNAIERLIEHWAGLEPSASSWIHPADQEALSGAGAFDLGFVPYPYVGDIRNADIWVLMLNSNIGPKDAIQEATPYFAERLRTNLRQDLATYEYPMLSLDPKLHDTGTYEYYNTRNGLSKLVAEFARRTGRADADARRDLAHRLAVVQLMPYRSTSGVPQALLGGAMPSVQLARAAVKKAVESKLVVMPRSARNWGFDYGAREPNLFVFKADQARSASLRPGGSCGGGDAILKRLAGGS
jgi:hypothetical protein